MKRLWLSLLLMALTLIACKEQQTQSQRVTPFSQLAASVPDAAPVVPGNPVVLPADHASHPAFRLEWWYLTATLSDISDRPYGLQFTLFRFTQPDATDNAWSDRQRWLAHVSLHTPDTHYFEEKVARGGVGNAGVYTSPFRAFIDHWQWQASPGTQDYKMFPSTLSVSATDKVSVSLQMRSTGPAVLHGDNGFSQKSADGRFRSYYYSVPFIDIRGSVEIDNKTLTVQGDGWFDHEWTSQLARGDALGWDWLSLSLDNGQKLMAFNMYVEGEPPFTTGTLINADGSSRTLSADEISLTPSGYEQINGKRLPVTWSVSIASAGIDIRISPFKKKQFNPGVAQYYEGRVEVTGSHRGRGFLELTGY
ncbi:lipocalin-like domain-containing protein [Alteromonas halophila]|uniref:Iron ABC transporter permease n=1 Tax=Alteromonas halophila TaxID=516698 RepID=A0A918MZS7_9ALTE|nr:lipocalin-like domain-containing protein [Alteromonas halophila]GGW86794.1 iron ABC transporter permease [Alteromonas halophila]